MRVVVLTSESAEKLQQMINEEINKVDGYDFEFQFSAHPIYSITNYSCLIVLRNKR
jgi:hypothetical protein